MIEYFNFEKNLPENINNEKLHSYPIVYILNNGQKNPMAYIGQTVQARNRMKSHYTNPDRRKLDKAILIGHEKFNQSATYNIETNLINHFIADNKYKLQNRSQFASQKTHNYYEKPYFHSHVFEEIWEELREKKIVQNSIEEIRNRDVFKLSPYKELSESQMELKNAIIKYCNQHIHDDRKAVFLIKGEAGTGKSVVLSSTFNTIQDLANDKDSFYSMDDLDNNLYGTENYLLVNHQEMLKTYESISTSLPNLKKKNFEKPTPFINKMQKENRMADITLVDEAHLLLSRTDTYNNFRGNNQLEEIIKQSKITVIVYDEKQFLKVKSHWSQDLLEGIVKDFHPETFELKDQFRMQASPKVVNWIDRFVQKELWPIPESEENFEIRVFDDATEMHELIVKRSKSHGLSRVVSTFDYVHKKDGADYFVEEPGFKKVWNRTHYKETWAEVPETINEVGSIYTIQGFDLNYVGVILGPSVTYNKEKDELEIDTSKYKDTGALAGESGAGEQNLEEVKERIILNSINVLMKRGVKGLFIYASNPELREKLMERKMNNEFRGY